VWSTVAARLGSVRIRAALYLGSWLFRLLGPARRLVVEVGHSMRFRPTPEERGRTVANHLRRDPEAGLAVARRRAERSFVEYVHTEVDFLRASAMPASRLRRECRVRGLEHLGAARMGNAIIAMVHFGNWDLPASIAGELGLHVTTVMSDYGDPETNAFVVRTRRRFGLDLFSPHDAARGLLRALRSGRCVGLLCDIPEAGPTVVVDFCGGPVRFSVVAARLARRTGAAIIPLDCWRVGGRYRMQVHPPIDVGVGEDDAAVTQRLAAVLERAIDMAPEQWYPFHEVFVDQREHTEPAA
jgi:lauroyl/myristoyl acyltransferase